MIKNMPKEPSALYIDRRVKEYLAQNPELDRNEMLKEVAELTLKYAKEFLLVYKAYNLESAVNFIYSLVDSYMEQATQAYSFSCKKGCSYCCHQHDITTTDYEAQAIAVYCKQNRINIPRKYLKAQLPFTKEEFAFSGKSACVFLKDKVCSIYPFRPVVCRTYAVGSPAHLCNTKLGTQTVGIFFSPEMEAIKSALVSAGATQGRLISLLLPHSK